MFATFDGQKCVDEKKIIQKTMEVSNNAFNPTSNFCVGATIVTRDDKVYTGANLELKSLLFTLCAERSAIAKAISNGETEFKKIYIYGHKRDCEATRFTPPCGVCLQTMNELCPSDFKIILVKSLTETETYKLKDLLPFGFNSKKGGN